MDLVLTDPPVHPRGCGERGGVSRRDRRAVGSSPRVRGTPDGVHVIPACLRFIPAGAGNAFTIPWWVDLDAVHPRGCGERGSRSWRKVLKNGSSPRVRGTRKGKKTSSGQARFIPAGAGNARAPRSRVSGPSVHPRGCGERFPLNDRLVSGSGSSPRVRGTHQCSARKQVADRFIPAGAGNAHASPCLNPSTAVHPRGCGERCFLTDRPAFKAGSSPRVRGTLLTRTTPERPPRFIPAGAGNAQWHVLG